MSALSCPDGADDVAKSRIAATFGPVPTKSKAAVLLSEPHAIADARRQLTKHGPRPSTRLPGRKARTFSGCCANLRPL